MSFGGCSPFVNVCNYVWIHHEALCIWIIWTFIFIVEYFTTVGPISNFRIIIQQNYEPKWHNLIIFLVVLFLYNLTQTVYNTLQYNNACLWVGSQWGIISLSLQLGIHWFVGTLAWGAMVYLGSVSPSYWLLSGRRVTYAWSSKEKHQLFLSLGPQFHSHHRSKGFVVNRIELWAVKSYILLMVFLVFSSPSDLWWN